MSEPVWLPSEGDLLEHSSWIDGVPGLRAQAEHWLGTIPARRAELGRRARAMALPVPHPLALGRIVELGGKAGVAAGLWAASGRRGALGHAERLVRGAGPAFVKLGQLIATSQGLLPDEVVESFAWCRDEVAPEPADVVVETIERDFGRPLAAVFADFDRTPLAAASIAQVHVARLHDGSDVVVKVQRRALRRRFEADIRAMSLLAMVLEWRLPAAKAANASGFVQLFSQLVAEELDFRVEALNMVEVGVANERAEMAWVRVPRPYPGLVTRKVLVMERLEGIRYADAQAIKDAGVDTKRLIRLAITGVLENTLVDGVFHGDLHAGNVMVEAGADGHGTFGLVDFGIVGRLTPDQRRALIRFMIAFAQDDVREMLEAMRAFGAVPADADLETLVPELEALAERADITDLTFDRMADALGDVIKVLVRHGFRLPKELVLFFKNLLYLSGSAAVLAPDLDLLGEVGPIFGHFQSRYGAEMSQIIGGGS